MDAMTILERQLANDRQRLTEAKAELVTMTEDRDAQAQHVADIEREIASIERALTALHHQAAADAPW